MSLYEFLGNNGVNSVDPNGESKWIQWGANVLVAVVMWIESGLKEGSVLRGHLDDEQLEWTRKWLEGKSDAPPPPPKVKPPRSPKSISPKRERVMSMIRRGPHYNRMGGGAAMVAGGVFLGGALAMASEAGALASTFGDYARHLSQGETAWADLDAATFAAQLQTGGSDYFFTMGVLSVLETIGDMAQ